MLLRRAADSKRNIKTSAVFFILPRKHHVLRLNVEYASVPSDSKLIGILRK
jgi:hypothetical protein